MKSSRKEIARLEAQIKNYQDHLPTLDSLGTVITLKYISDTQAQLEKVKKAYDQKQARRLERKGATTPKHKKLFTLKSFSFTNRSGGTGLSNWEFDPHFSGVAQAEVITQWEDYETGRRHIGKAVSQDLIDYLKVNASPTDQRVFFSEFEVISTSKYSVSEGDALPANMDLDGSLLEAENDDYAQMALEAQVRDGVTLNAHARKMLKKKSALGKHMASFNFEKLAAEGLIDAGDPC